MIKYAIVGTGGLGGYYGGRLADSGQEVYFLLHKDYQEVSRRQTLIVDSVKGDFVLQSPHIYRDSKEMPVCDVVLVCMKTCNNHLLPEILSPIVHPGSVVVLVQNGLRLEEELAEKMPHQALAGATAFICSYRVGAGHIRHDAYGELNLAPFRDCPQDVLHQVCADLEAAGVPTHFEPDLHALRWKKLVWNIPYNGLTVILNAKTDRLTFEPAARDLVCRLMREVVEAAAASGVQIPSDYIGKMLDLTEKMTPYWPSMRLDYDARRPMEVRTMYSNPIQEARENGYEMKMTEVMEKQLLFLGNY